MENEKEVVWKNGNNIISPKQLFYISWVFMLLYCRYKSVVTNLHIQNHLV